jgi:glucose-1-phosphate thymidylyltransferase
MTEDGCVFKPGEVIEWMDCGNKEVTVHTNQRVLEHDWAEHKGLVHPSVKVNESIIIPPCHIGENVILSHSVIGPHVSIGSGSHIENSIIKNSIIQHKTAIVNSILQDSMIGSNVVIKGTSKDLSLGDYCSYHA